MPDSSQEFHNKVLGRAGENLVCNYLRRHGDKIVARNYVTPFGEADIVALKDGTYCLVEVKTRTGDILALPSEAVTRAKQERYRKIALFLCAKLQREVSVRYDVASVLDGEIEYFEGAFI